MGEIRLRFAYPVPPERVWQALTDSSQLSSWFMDNDFVPSIGHRFILWPGGLRGFDGPVNAVVLNLDPPARDRPGRLVMGWHSGQSHALVTWGVEPWRRGSRLRIAQSGVFGAEGTPSKDLVETYRTVFGDRLRRFVGGVAETAGTPGRLRLPLWVPLRGPWRVVAAVIAILVVTGVVATAAWMILPQPAKPFGEGALGDAPTVGSVGTAPDGGTGTATPGPNGSLSPGPAGPGSTPGGPGSTPSAPGPTPKQSSPATATPTPVSSVLTAIYTVREGPIGHDVIDIVVSNGGSTAVVGWTVALELSPLDLVVLSDTSQVFHDVTGGRHIFTPTDKIRTVPAGASVTFTTTVTPGLGSVDSCTIDGRPCLRG